ncbi:MAG: DNA polymerase I [Proteobacteria bacterium]|jgi:DNA polymerase-1|nr:DNA polymerase I [Pseudomonadota bacterium]
MAESSGKRVPLPWPEGTEILYLVDISSFVFRAYYSVKGLSTARGEPTNALFGVANMLVSLFKDYEPSHVAVAMDSRTPTFRREIYPAYKANRPPPPEDLKVQFPFVRELVEAFDLAVLQRDGFEADDLIATAARTAVRSGLKVVVVSADKDLMQLVGPDVVMLDTMKEKLWDAAAVEEKWGVPPSLLGDLLAIGGDSSDNIPGVPRVGPKTAAPLLAEHGGLEQLLANLDKLGSKALAARLAEHAEAARMSRRLVELAEVEGAVDLGATRHGPPSKERLGPVLDRFELKRLKERLFGVDAEPRPPAPDVEYRTIATLDGLRAAAEEIRAAGRFAVDLETTSVSPVLAEIVGVALSWRPLEAAYVPIAHAAGPSLPLADVLAALRPLLEDPSLGAVAQNAKYEEIIFRRHGVRMANVAFDPMLASYLLRGEGRAHNLDALAKEILGRSTVTYEEVTEKARGTQLAFAEVTVERATRYSGEDAEVALALADAMAPRIEAAGLRSLLADVELPLGRVLAAMELAGVRIDADLLGEMSIDYAVALAALEKDAYAAAGHELNLASPKQLQQVLFEELGLPSQRKTKTGYSTDSEVLELLAPLHPLPAILVEHRLLAKLKGTYLDALPRLVNPATGRIHTSFNQTVTATGRLSSSNPNLQNIPIRTDRGRDIRRAFVAEPGNVLLSADYSQIELRVLAHISEDAELVAAFRAGEDVHARTARAVFGIPAGAEVPREKRAQAKAINFGVIYGKTEFSLAKELGIPRGEARRFIDGYFALHVGVARYMEETIASARETLSVATMLGRRRELPDLASANHNVRQAAERMARNTPIQGTAADLLKLAMIRVDRRLAAERLRARMILTVHDELVLEVPEDEVDRAKTAVREEMENALELRVPLVVDTGVGQSWAEAH